MSVSSDLYNALSPIMPADRVFDTKLPDEFALSESLDSIIVFQLISDVPSVPIDGKILGYQQRWQVSVWSIDLATARTLKASVITALHMLRAGAIKLCEFESCPGEIYEDSVPPEYHIPIDFMVSI